MKKDTTTKGGKKIEKWIEDDDICVNDLLALVCAKFGMIPQVARNEITVDKTELMIAGVVYKITIEKEV